MNVKERIAVIVTVIIVSAVVAMYFGRPSVWCKAVVEHNGSTVCVTEDGKVYSK